LLKGKISPQKLVCFFPYHIGLGKTSGHVPSFIGLGLAGPVAPLDAEEGPALPKSFSGPPRRGEPVFNFYGLDGVPGLVGSFGG